MSLQTMVDRVTTSGGCVQEIFAINVEEILERQYSKNKG